MNWVTNITKLTNHCRGKVYLSIRNNYNRRERKKKMAPTVDLHSKLLFLPPFDGWSFWATVDFNFSFDYENGFRGVALKCRFLDLGFGSWVWRWDDNSFRSWIGWLWRRWERWCIQMMCLDQGGVGGWEAEEVERDGALRWWEWWGKAMMVCWDDDAR